MTPAAEALFSPTIMAEVDEARRELQLADPIYRIAPEALDRHALILVFDRRTRVAGPTGSQEK